MQDFRSRKRQFQGCCQGSPRVRSTSALKFCNAKVTMAHNSPNHCGVVEKSQQCHKYFLQCSHICLETMHSVCSIAQNCDLTMQMCNTSLRQRGQCSVLLGSATHVNSTNHGTQLQRSNFGKIPAIYSLVEWVTGFITAIYSLVEWIKQFSLHSSILAVQNLGDDSDFRPPSYVLGNSDWWLCGIGVRAGKFLGVRRIFAQISANLTEMKRTSKKTTKTTALHWAQGTSTTIFAQISPKLAQISPN